MERLLVASFLPQSQVHLSWSLANVLLYCCCPPPPPPPYTHTTFLQPVVVLSNIAHVFDELFDFTGVWYINGSVLSHEDLEMACT